MRRDRPARAAAREVGARRRRRRARPVRRRLPRGAGGPRGAGEAPVGVLRTARVARRRGAGAAAGGLAARRRLVLLDVKRGDIGSTMQGLRRRLPRRGRAVGADAVTVSPYLGFGSLARRSTPRTARAAGVFVLARTSNAGGGGGPGGRRRGRSVAQGIVDRGGRPQPRRRAAWVAPRPRRGGHRRPRARPGRAERPGARPRPRRAGRGARRHRRPLPRRTRPRSACGEPLGPRGGPRRPPALRGRALGKHWRS